MKKSYFLFMAIISAIISGLVFTVAFTSSRSNYSEIVEDVYYNNQSSLDTCKFRFLAEKGKRYDIVVSVFYLYNANPAIVVYNNIFRISGLKMDEEIGLYERLLFDADRNGYYHISLSFSGDTDEEFTYSMHYSWEPNYGLSSPSTFKKMIPLLVFTIPNAFFIGSMAIYILLSISDRYTKRKVATTSCPICNTSNPINSPCCNGCGITFKEPGVADFDGLHEKN